MQTDQIAVNPWNVDETQFDKRTKEYKELMEARANTPKPEPGANLNTENGSAPDVNQSLGSLADLPQKGINTSFDPKVQQQQPKPYSQQPPLGPEKPQEPETSVRQASSTQITQTDVFQFPPKVILKPISAQKFRLGLENTTEGFLKVPGTKYTYEPSIVGKNHKTGLHRLNRAQIAQLEEGIGSALDSDFYSELSYRMDASNPNGHHMDLSRPLEKIVYLTMLESHLVAQGLVQKQNGQKPEAEWYIENLDAEAEIEFKEQDRFRKVFGLYTEISDRKKVAFAKIFNLPVRGLSPKVADTKLWNLLLDKKQINYKKILDRFIEMCAWSDEKVNVYEEVKDAIAGNIIRRNGAQDYIYGEDVLGATEEHVIGKLLLNENAGVRMSIKHKLNLR